MPSRPRPAASPSPRSAGRTAARRRALVAKLFNPTWYAKRRFAGDGKKPGQTELDSGQLLEDYLTYGAALDIPPHPLFDPVWYRSQLPQDLQDAPPDWLAVEHYLTEGRNLSPHPCFDPASAAGKAAPRDRNPLLNYLKDRSTWRLAPNPLFSGSHYLGLYPDVAQAGSQPLVHYLRVGEREKRTGSAHFDFAVYRALAGRPMRHGAMADFLSGHLPPAADGAAQLPYRAIENPAQVVDAMAEARWAYSEKAVLRRVRLYKSVSPLFDPAWYVTRRFGATLADVADRLEWGTWLDDYLLKGAALGLSPHPLFDPAWYTSQFPWTGRGTLAVTHYLARGASLSPHPAFDPASPAAQAAQSAGEGVNPLVNYVTNPETWTLAPNEVFDGANYLELYPDVALAGVNPLTHYLAYGEQEHRSPSDQFDVKAYRTAAGLPDDAPALVHYLSDRLAAGKLDCDQIAFPEQANPEVSIIIPVYGQWAHTRACLRSLAAAKSTATFEVIVVDDAGPDQTSELLAKAPGVRLIRHEVNTGYIGACNTGIKAARGDMVLLLNNDTKVDPDWLDPLVQTLRSDGVGLVGAKLVYPDGRLQEAGGIIFSDGSGYNYGRYLDPADSRFNYQRRVDYCSGAAVIVRKSTLDQLGGGLDETFAPAYYDDTDLAFGVRSLGLDVVYEPRSVVIHDEGTSHGTDETSGIKTYQRVNREKFRAKWAEALTHQPAPGTSPERAARARQGNDLVVVIDHYVPRPDQDSGSLRMSRLLAELVAQGHGVILVPADASASGRYGKALRQGGIEVAHGRHNWPKFFADLEGSVRAVVVSRISTALAFAPIIRSALPGVPLLFDTVDLHFMRLEREAQLAAVPGADGQATLTRELELAMIRSADTTLVVSGVEHALLANLVPDADVQVLSNVHAPIPDSQIPPIDGRDGLVFVGSFAHTPNLDAAEWFTSKVLPLVRRELPDLPVVIVGADPPPDLVAEAPDGVEYAGWVPDLGEVYGQVRAAIAPLRYGAGVKGKVGEAMAYGVPVVTTPVGAEGMSLDDGATALIAEDPQDFAAAICRIVRDDQLWRAISSQARNHINNLLGPQAFSQAVQQAIPSTNPT
ncbi:MAG: glycosyltransferase [Bifidobacteriaceae bacterium]|jgi:GT2 family glycosyltransferase/glycosyltransferase involved in cell wall biosynthesis|nr:glycosyltransferase [Bifidobacteriaceae bacterium]